MPISQENRALQATAPIADDFVPVRMVGEERLSAPFLFTVDFVSENLTDIAPSQLLHKGITLHVELHGGEQRHIHGLVRRFTQLGPSGFLTYYRVEIVPALWFMALSSDCRTWEEKGALDIVEEVCKAAGVTDIRRRVVTTPAARPYTVQYRESNLAFVSRLLEEAGLYYTFEHEEGKHTLIFSDSVATSIPAGLIAEVKVDSANVAGEPSPNTVRRFTREFGMHSAKVEFLDHELLRADNAGSTGSTGAGAFGARFEFLGDFGPNDSSGLSRRMVEADEAGRDVVRGESNCQAFHSGTRVKLLEGPLPAAGEEFHLLRVAHHLEVGDTFSGSGPPARYTNAFDAIPASVKFRPLPATPRPSVRGTQTAVIVGAGAKGAIDVDDKGMVLVQFPWDRGAGKGGNSKHRVHVASVWSGTKWGFVQIPRVGQEVLVEYLEGDLERPLITGRVYNSTHQFPYDLPANKTQSGWKSRTLDGGAENFNEIRFDDKKGSEHISVQAEKDLQVLVKNDETREVRHDRTTTITNHDTRTVKEGNDTHTVSKGNQKVTVTEGDQTIEVKKGKQTITVESDQALTVNKGNRATTVSKGNDTHKVDTGNLTIGVAKGNISIKADAGKIDVEAAQSIELKVGSSSIKLDPASITIKGTMIKIEGTGTAEMKSPMTTVKGDGMLTLKGGMTMIN